jgi:hypothetical protein
VGEGLRARIAELEKEGEFGADAAKCARALISDLGL